MNPSWKNRVHYLSEQIKGTEFPLISKSKPHNSQRFISVVFDNYIIMASDQIYVE